jgi:hypothetical protein
MQRIFIIITLFACADHIKGQTYLRADGSADTYALINRVFGSYGTGEMPDCSHPSFGRHIFQGNDGQLNKQVFFFHAHRDTDNDRCQNFDRQRTEIRPDQGALTAANGETMSFSWNFKLDAGFQPSTSFTHIFQLKAVSGDDGMPLITFTPRYNSGGNQMEVIHVNSAGTTTKVRTVPLAPFLGVWVKVVTSVTYGTAGNGHYSVNMSTLNGGQNLLSYTSGANFQMWRSGATYYRPKWGIYRSLENKQQLRDEIVRFDNFCLAKGSAKCT